MYLLTVYFFWKNVCSGPLPILKLGYLVILILSGMCSLYTLDISLIRCVVCKYLSSISQAAFSFY